MHMKMTIHSYISMKKEQQYILFLLLLKLQMQSSLNDLVLNIRLFSNQQLSSLT